MEEAGDSSGLSPAPNSCQWRGPRGWGPRRPHLSRAALPRAVMGLPVLCLLTSGHPRAVPRSPAQLAPGAPAVASTAHRRTHNTHDPRSLMSSLLAWDTSVSTLQARAEPGPGQTLPDPSLNE